MREITFDIPGDPSLTIHAMEQPDGSILFDLSVTGDELADLRGLFFNLADTSLVGDLVAAGDDLSDQAYGDVSGFKNGNNMRGQGRNPYDVGLNFGTPGIGKDDISSTSFVLSSVSGDPLTLDLIAHVEFGARLTSIGLPESEREDSAKITAIAPAAPDAIDDTGYTLEDNDVTVDVVANDTDADGDPLTVIEVGNPANGTVAIAGNQVLYTPNEHWSGVDSFTYRIFDGDGGYDIATTTITVEAVADAPNLSLAVRPGADVNEIIVDITSSLVDTDGSETYVLTFSDLPPGAVLVGAPGNEIPVPTGTDSVTIVLDDGADYDFDFSVSATSTEASNGDTATTTETIEVDFEYNEITENVTFEANDQSMWHSGDEFVFEDDRFLGIDISDSGSNGGLISTSWSYDLMAGFQSDLTFEGGDIDADIPWDLNFDTSFNHTTDVLVLDTSATLANGGFFQTEGPSLEYMLDFIFNYDLYADVDLYIDLGILGEVDEDLFTIDIGDDYTVNIVDYDSETSGGLSYDFPYGITATLEWPNLEVDGTQVVPGTYSGDGASNNALGINLDIDDLVADIFFGGINPFSWEVDLLVAGGSLDLIDVDVMAGMNFLQDFTLEAGGLDAYLVFEDGSTADFTFGDELVFDFASDLDVDNDGNVEFEVVMDLVGSTLDNDTDLGFNVGWNFDMVEVSWWYDILVASDSGSIGPLVDLGDPMIPVFDIDVFDTTVDVAFEQESIDIFA